MKRIIICFLVFMLALSGFSAGIGESAGKDQPDGEAWRVEEQEPEGIIAAALDNNMYYKKHIVAARGWYTKTGFADWEYNHTYLVVLKGDLSGINNSGPIAFLNKKRIYDEVIPYTEKWGKTGGYVICTVPEYAAPGLEILLVMNNKASVNLDICILDVTDAGTVDSTNALFVYNTADKDTMSAFDIVQSMSFLQKEGLSNSWNGRNVLFIGDSLTEANRYQHTVVEKLGISYSNHSAGGIGITGLIDGNDSLAPLSREDVAGKDLIVFYAGYNNRATLVGETGDLYKKDGTGQSTIAGYMQYAINSIYELLAEADNLECKLLIVTVDCAGKYPWIDADGYEEYPQGSGQTMETIANIQKSVAEANGIPCLDLWHNSGINRYTWSVYGADPTAYYEDAEDRGGKYPHNGDQLHKSDAGYERIGSCIVGAILSAYGN